MKNLLELKASLGRLRGDEREYEVLAAGSGAYDATSKMLAMSLRCFLQEDPPARPTIHADWMPRDQTDREHVDPDEATDLGREIFRRWCDSVRHAAPRPLH